MFCDVLCISGGFVVDCFENYLSPSKKSAAVVLFFPHAPSTPFSFLPDPWSTVSRVLFNSFRLSVVFSLRWFNREFRFRCSQFLKRSTTHLASKASKASAGAPGAGKTRPGSRGSSLLEQTGWLCVEGLEGKYGTLGCAYKGCICLSARAL